MFKVRAVKFVAENMKGSRFAKGGKGGGMSGGGGRGALGYDVNLI